MIKIETIKEFQEVISEEKGMFYTFEEASSILNGLVGYYDLLAKIDYRKRLALENPDLAPEQS